MSKILALPHSIISKIEAKNSPFFYFLFVFFFSIVVRNFLEVITYREIKLSDWYAHMHYSTYYLALVGWIIILIKVFVKEKTETIAKVVLTFMPIIIICPIIDFGVHQFADFHQVLGYLSPELHGNFFSQYFLFFGNHIGEKLGPSIGYRIEVLFVLIGLAIYIWVKTENLIKAFLGFLALYTLIYFFCSTPYVLKNFLGLSPYSPQLVPYYLLLTLFSGLLIFYSNFKKETLILIKDFRWLRLGFYELIFLFGLVYGLTNGGIIKASIIYQGVFTLIAIAFSWKYAVMINNLEDLKIDAVSNPSRPLLQNFNTSFYKTISWWVLVISMVFSLYADVVIWQFITIFSLNYFIYSAEPLRLKRIPILSKLPIAVNILLLFLLGNIYVGNNTSNIPNEIIWFIIIGGTLALNFIDIKDFEGDKKAGIKTLPVLIGLKPAKFILGITFLGGHLLGFLFTDSSTTYFVLVGLGILQLIFITSKKYSDSKVVGTFLVAILITALERFF